VFSYDCQVLQTLSVWCRVCARPGLVRAVRMFWSQLVEWVFGAQVTGQVARHASSSWRACCIVRVVRPPVFVASTNGKQARKTLPPSAAQDRVSLFCLVRVFCFSLAAGDNSIVRSTDQLQQRQTPNGFSISISSLTTILLGFFPPSFLPQLIYLAR
jgi:hypothetical protein